MLREDKKLEMVRLSATLPRMFSGRWALQAGQRVNPDRWNDAQIEAWRRDQQNHPVRVCVEGRRTLWWFRERFYWDDDGHSADDVKALVLQRTRRAQRKLQSALALMKGEESGAARRQPIASELARAVVKRDGRRCVQCGATEELQFDHILPIALGGATSLENLQILCCECNRAKSDAL